MMHMLLQPTFFLSGILLCFPIISSAACSKEDIQFYLDKGFNQEQITELCTTSEASVPDYTPYQQQVIIYSEEEAPGIKGGFTREERAAIKDLKNGMDVVDLSVDQETIQYTVQVCVMSSEGKEYDQRYKACPEVLFKVSRRGLTTVTSGKKYGLFGKQTIKIKGDIERQSLVDFDTYPIEFRRQLKRDFDWKEGDRDTAKFPVRGDYSVTTLVNALDALSKPDTNVTIVENADDDEVEVEVEPVAETESKKKKRWWNPLD